MKTYTGLTQVQAESLSRGGYYQYQGWTVPAHVDPSEDGFMVVYPDGFRYWSPADTFNKEFIEVSSNSGRQILADYQQTVSRRAEVVAELSTRQKQFPEHSPKPASLILLEQQARILLEYENVLRQQAFIELIDLDNVPFKSPTAK